MGLINHFADTAEGFGITVPDVTDIATTNSPNTTTTGMLGLNGEQCKEEWGSKPTFILVDFWNVGPSVQTADNLNGIVATGRTSVSTAEVTAGSSPGNMLSAGGLGRMCAIAMGAVAVGNILWL